jgi:hypothetical protein
LAARALLSGLSEDIMCNDEPETTPAMVMTMLEGFLLREYVAQAIDSETVKIWRNDQHNAPIWLTRHQLVKIMRLMENAPRKKTRAEIREQQSAW